MQMIRWMCGISMKDRRIHEELRRLVGVEHTTTVIRSGRLRWYGHARRKSDEDWVNKCMEFRVDGRRPVGRPRRTWLLKNQIWQNLRSTNKMPMTVLWRHSGWLCVLPLQ